MLFAEARDKLAIWMTPEERALAQKVSPRILGSLRWCRSGIERAAIATTVDMAAFIGIS